MTRLFAFLLITCLLLVSGYCQKGNPADELVDALNGNRSAFQLTTLPINPGLGCIALEYIKDYYGNCTSINNSINQPTDDSLRYIYAPACKVDPSTLAPITGKIISCQDEYLEPEVALSMLLTTSKKSNETVRSNNYTQVGAAVAGIIGKGPYLWCLLFSDEHARVTFAMSDLGKGCFGGSNVNCSATNTSTTPEGNPADELVVALNQNRSAFQSTTLPSSPGLGCIALEYIKDYKGNCTSFENSADLPSIDNLRNIYVPNCRVDPSTLAPITGMIVACQDEYIKSKAAFSTLLLTSEKSIQMARSVNHTQVGAAVVGVVGKGPYFWCLLFSNVHARKTFVMRGAGKGCFSGSNVGCSVTDTSSNPVGNPADKIVEVLNNNRTHYLSTGLASSSGLGCLTLEYINAYNGSCATANDGGYHPTSSDIIYKFAPLCGVQSSTVADISGSLIACQNKYVEPEIAFSTLLADDTTNLHLVLSNNHTQVGAAVVSNYEKTDYFWSLLFSNRHAQKSFLETSSAISGCFSGRNESCSMTSKKTTPPAPVQASSPAPQTNIIKNLAPAPNYGNRIQCMFWIVVASILASITLIS